MKPIKQRIITQRIILASAIFLAGQSSIALAAGNSTNPWSPAYQPAQNTPPPAYQQQRVQQRAQQRPQQRPPQQGMQPGPRAMPQHRSQGPGRQWAGQPPARPPMPPQAYNRPAPGQGAYPPPPPRGWAPRNAGPSAFFTPGFNPRNDRWGGNRSRFWGRSGPGTWMNPNKRNMEQGWDDMLNAPSRMGEMPGGWTAPSVSMPNPIDIGDQFQDNARDLPDQMRNMDVGN
ncbi:MAG TPA: hypothetical protein ENJ64_02825 [Thiotrichales bacterium]|nr:hypothetical protein [Thiotrichales bacterium]